MTGTPAHRGFVLLFHCPPLEREIEPWKARLCCQLSGLHINLPDLARHYPSALEEIGEYMRAAPTVFSHNSLTV